MGDSDDQPTTVFSQTLDSFTETIDDSDSKNNTNRDSVTVFSQTLDTFTETIDDSDSKNNTNRDSVTVFSQTLDTFTETIDDSDSKNNTNRDSVASTTSTQTVESATLSRKNSLPDSSPRSSTATDFDGPNSSYPNVDLRKELESLRDFRRSSIAQPVTLDPDLPRERPQTDSLETSLEDPSRLFWVPARAHPEIAPQGFKEFLKQHAQNSTDRGQGALNRSKSKLRMQYKPSENDGVGQRIERDLPLHKHPAFEVPPLSLADLQKLEELAEEATINDDPTKLGNVLRRSLSLNISPQAALKLLDEDDPLDMDRPIIIPPPGQILRRTARTKIRKPSLAGDGGGHRFASHRRSDSMKELSTHTSLGTLENHNQSFSSEEASKLISETNEPMTRSGSQSSHRSASAMSITNDVTSSQSSPYESDNDDDFSNGVRLHDPPVSRIKKSQSPSLQEVQNDENDQVIGTENKSVTSLLPITTSATELQGRQQIRMDLHPQIQKEVETESQPKKSGWPWKLFSFSDTEDSRPVKQKNSGTKEPSLFQSLFSKKSKNDVNTNSNSHALYQSPLSAMLKNKKYINSNRLPIHVERAIYRLSHIKLTNPRRPLYEQVLISNLMFWYLSIINTPVQPIRNQSLQAQPRPQNQNAPVNSNGKQDVKQNGGRTKRSSLKVPESRRRPNSSAEGYAIRPVKYELQQQEIMKQHGNIRPTSTPSFGDSSDYIDYTNSNQPLYGPAPHMSPSSSSSKPNRHSSPPQLPLMQVGDALDIIMDYAENDHISQQAQPF